MRITLDSAILARAHNRANGPARALLVELLDRGHKLVLSPSLLEEVERVLRYPRLAKRFGLTEVDVAEFVGFLFSSAELVALDETISVPISDPKDIHVVQAAVSGRAEYLCTLDTHFYHPPVLAFCIGRGLTVITDVSLLQLVRDS